MTTPMVFVVDDDEGLRYSLSGLLKAARFEVECYACAEDFLSACDENLAGCILLDVRMPGMSGINLQEELIRRQIRLPIIFLTGYGELSTGIDAMKRGAADFLTKPVNGDALLTCVSRAMDLDREQRRTEAARRLFRSRLIKLTAREREVLLMALSGIDSREIGCRLRISVRTVEGHRGRIYLKTGVGSLLDLSQQAASAGVCLAETLA